MTSCPECGAVSTPEMNCQSVFDECLVKEFEDPGFGEVHHLTVAAYMLQHSSKLTREGWSFMRQLLWDFLVKNEAPSQVRIRSKDAGDSGKRHWKITSRGGLAKIEAANWTKTILDVHRDDSEVYCADITAWAKAALEDSQGISW